MSEHRAGRLTVSLRQLNGSLRFNYWRRSMPCARFDRAKHVFHAGFERTWCITERDADRDFQSFGHFCSLEEEWGCIVLSELESGLGPSAFGRHSGQMKKVP